MNNAANEDFENMLYLLKDTKQFLISRYAEDSALYFNIDRLLNKYNL